MPDDTDLQPAVAAEYLALADLLDGASDQVWDTPSLCEGWRAREVIAHVTMAARHSEETFMAELQACDFDFTRLSNQLASRDAELPTGELLANLRSDVMHHWTRGGGHAHFGIDIGQRSLQATDLDWSYGSGLALRGAAEELALAMCGRKLHDGRLEGAPL